jgi:ABC-type Fe3+/spermidine/putrescine transport system ATPase subunit
MTAIAPAISVSRLDKIYASGFQALKNINLDIRHGEIFALLGPNGAGKTTLIGVICGIVNPSSGTVTVDHFRLSAGALADRSGAPGIDHRRLRNAAGDLTLFPRVVRQARQPGLHR